MLLSSLHTWRRLIRSRIARGASRRRSQLSTTQNTALYRVETLEDRILLAATPTIQIDDVSQPEGDSGSSSFVFTVSRSGKTNQPSTIEFVTSDDTAMAGEDYQATSGTLIFNAGVKTLTITVPVNGDGTVEPDDTFYVDLTIVNNGKFGDSRGVGTIENDDTGPSLPALSIDDVQLAEGDRGTTTAFQFTVIRSGDTSGTSSVDWTTVDGSATIADSDYTADSGILTFIEGQTSGTITVQINGDTTIEPDETFTVELSNPVDATINAGSGLAVVVDDDGPNDPLFGSQWNLNNVGQTGGTVDADIDAVEAWNITTGSLSTVVAIIDRGGAAEYFHEDLYLNIWINEGEIPIGVIDTDADGIITFYDLNDSANASWTTDFNGTGYIDAGDLLADPVWENNIDDDANGYIDDLIGWDFEENDNDPYDPTRSHATKQAGELGAIGNNGVGLTGVNWRVRIMSLRNPLLQLPESGVDSLNYAVAQGVTISNNSWGYYSYSQQMYDAIQAAGEAGHVFIAAAGNGGTDNDTTPFYPASYDLNNIISVTGTDHNDIYGPLVNQGVLSVDVAAPSSNFQSTYLNNTYQIASTGETTSAATPHVSGIAALIKSHYPNVSGSQIRDLILGSVDPLPSLARIITTGGRVNAASALQITTIGSDDVSVVEGNASTTQLVFDVRWSGDTSQPVTVDWSTSDGTALAGTDYIAASGQLVFDNPAINIQTITIDVLGDIAVELDETLSINLSISTGNAVLVENQIVGTILKDDIGISISDAIVVEGDYTITFNDPTATTEDHFGRAVSIDGNRLLVGDQRDDTLGTDVGQAHLFDTVTGNLLMTFNDPTVTGSDNFGHSVAIDGNLVLIGAHLDDGTGIDVGQAYLFDATTGDLLQTFSDPDPQPGDQFGWTIGLDGNNVLISAFQDDTLGANVGQAYLFDAITGNLLHTFNDPTPTNGDEFGHFLAIEGNHVIVGAPTDDTNGIDVGQAHLFDVVTGDLLQTFDNPSGLQGDRFGHSVWVDGNNVLVGAWGVDALGVDVGRAFLFDAVTGNLLQTFDDPTPTTSDWFSRELVIQGDRVLIGALQDDTFGDNVGQAYLFDAVTGALLRTFDDPTITGGDEFGRSIALDGNTVVVGAYRDSTLGFEVGQAHLFTLGAPVANFTVSLSSPSDELVTVDFATSDGTAKVIDGDYIATSGTLTFTPGLTTRTIIVSTIDDELEEPTESFFVNLSAATGAVIQDSQGEATIVDDNDGEVFPNDPLFSQQWSLNRDFPFGLK
jgi:hypothetical protein